VTPAESRALLARLLHGIAPEVELDDLDPSRSLTDEAELDSIDFLNLVSGLHDLTGIDIPERDYPEIRTVDGWVTYLSSEDAKT
jgi:acyl carrier protein